MNQCIKDFKKRLRKKFLNERNALDIKIREDIDKKIIKNILESYEYISAKNIFTFVGIGSEINTIPLIEKAIEDKKDVFVPLCIDKSSMESRKINSISELEEKHFGLLEPSINSEKIEINKIDLSIIPCLAVDKEGYRLGYGGGYYDRYFANTNINNAFIVCRGDFIIDSVPYENFDIKFNKIVSENGIVTI